MRMDSFSRMRMVALACLLLTALALLGTSPGLGQDNASTEAVEKRQEEEKQKQKEKEEAYRQLSESLDKSIQSQKETIRTIEEQLDKFTGPENPIDRKLNEMKLQASAFGGLLVANTPVENLEKTLAYQQVAIQEISAQLDQLQKEIRAIEDQRLLTEDQYEINQKQLVETRSLKAEDPVTKKLLADLDVLGGLISRKRDLLKKLQTAYELKIDDLQATRETFKTLREKFSAYIEERKKQDLFEKTENPLMLLLGWKRVLQEVEILVAQGRLMASRDFWQKQWEIVRSSGGVLPVTSILLFFLIEVAFLKLRRFCIAFQQRAHPSTQPCRRLVLQLIGRSSPLMGAVLFIYGYGKIQSFYNTFVAVRVVVTVLAVWLFCFWAKELLKLLRDKTQVNIPDSLDKRLRFLIGFVRVFAIAIVVLRGILGSGSFIAAVLRVVFEATLLVWNVSFWKDFNRRWSALFPAESRWRVFQRTTLITAGYVAVGGGLLLELAGYGQLAYQWYASWGRTLVVLLWTGLVFFLIREWDRTSPKPPAKFEPTEYKRTAHSLRWFLIRSSWLVWAGGLSVFLLLAWGAQGPVIVNFFRILNHRIPLGAVEVSLLGVVYAILILLFTQAVSHLWRLVLQQKILEKSGLEVGLQASITRLSVYALWIVGILASLNALGISGTSLAVAFGALGIGIGFGLQNIFNNFLSGVILMFERPIQVGDSIEIGGVWGTVTKINVRSTVVQTFDNAALIIPNSEFISGQVTNWTFKDVRLRRQIRVGVAYGSHLETVRDTLMEIASNHSNVLKFPRPDVLFEDFGDSSLVFNLRVWTTLDYCLSAETEIRFEIDRLFRERDIEIAFPQRDIHIRSVVEGPGVSLKKAPEDAEPPSEGKRE